MNLRHLRAEIVSKSSLPRQQGLAYPRVPDNCWHVQPVRTAKRAVLNTGRVPGPSVAIAGNGRHGKQSRPGADRGRLQGCDQIIKGRKVPGQISDSHPTGSGEAASDGVCRVLYPVQMPAGLSSTMNHRWAIQACRREFGAPGAIAGHAEGIESNPCLAQIVSTSPPAPAAETTRPQQANRPARVLDKDLAPSLPFSILLSVPCPVPSTLLPVLCVRTTSTAAAQITILTRPVTGVVSTYLLDPFDQSLQHHADNHQKYNGCQTKHHGFNRFPRCFFGWSFIKFPVTVIRNVELPFAVWATSLAVITAWQECGVPAPGTRPGTRTAQLRQAAGWYRDRGRG